MAVIDLTGQTFGRWTVLERAGMTRTRTQPFKNQGEGNIHTMNNDEQTRDTDRRMAAKEGSGVMVEERSDRAREKWCRREADRKDLTVVKSRRRDPRFADYGRYWIVEVQAPGGGWRSRWVVAGGNFGLSLDELERALSE